MSSENGLRERLLRTRSIDALIAASQGPERRLCKTLGPWSLIGLGVGAVIGSGIFILTGTAAAGQQLQFKSILNAPILDLMLNGGNAVSTIGRLGAGPGISLSFLVTAAGLCGFAALACAELASMIPICGQRRTRMRMRRSVKFLCVDYRGGIHSRICRFEYGCGGRVFQLPERPSR